MELTIIIPAFNEEKGIGLVIDQVKKAVRKIRHEIIVVDDGSGDKTAEIVRKKKVGLIRHPQNLGYGAAIQTGIRMAKGDYIAILDADDSYPPEKIPEMLKIIKQGYDLVIGARTGRYYRYSWFKQPVRFIFKLVAEFVTGTRIPDPNSGLRIYRRKTITPLIGPHTCRGFSFSTSTTIIFILEGKFVKFMPIPYFPRKGKSKVRFIRDALRAGQILAETIVYYNPFKLFLLIGLIFIAFMLIWILVYLINYSILALTFISLFFASSVASFFLGLSLSLFKKGIRNEA